MLDKFPVEMVAVHSSHVVSVGYDGARSVLYVSYIDGNYLYRGVSKRTFSNILKASSVGGYLSRNVIGKYPTAVVGNTTTK